MQGIIYEEASFLSFFIITCTLGGWAAWMTGRGCALTWRSMVQALVYMLPLGLAVRFIHFVIAGSTLLSAHYYAVDTAVLIILCALGFQYTRTSQMVRQYSWLFRKSSPFSWRRTSHETPTFKRKQP